MSTPKQRRRRRWPFPVLALLLILGLGAVHSTDWLRSFGAQPTGDRLTRLQRSPRYRNGAFENAIPTERQLPGSFWRTVKLQFSGDQQRLPPAAIPIVAGTRETYASLPASGLRATWLGHSSTLIEIDGVRVLTDPVWGERASPSTWVGPRRFHPPPLPLAELPQIDGVVISHDHYDHLDMPTIRALAADSAQPQLRFVVPLGIGAHLERWGIAPDRIVELDWSESTTVGPLTLTATPARHFSGRGLWDRNHTLWASWSVAGPRHRVFHSGDTGPFAGFAAIGDAYGPFDLTLVKIGAYDELWPDIHLNPEQAVDAHTRLRGSLLLPIHWGTYNLAFHAWDEPAERVTAAAISGGARLVMPRPGESIEPERAPPVRPWWRDVRPR